MTPLGPDSVLPTSPLALNGRPVVRCGVCERRFATVDELGTALPAHVGIDGEPCPANPTLHFQPHLRRCRDCLAHVQPLYLEQYGEYLPQHNRSQGTEEWAVEPCPGSGKTAAVVGPGELPRQRPPASASPPSGIDLRRGGLPVWLTPFLNALITWAFLVGALVVVVSVLWLIVTLTQDDGTAQALLTWRA
ncbi:hypothetical protein LWF15_21480 [Kineosporia rhizophila]|uniref:hypothetical protein n=1 Tax=Kineosporia rhizophila TaxID=84633 RepID=UPI001E411D8A|nr:hypothetical protein [Kineosporia rhizophila]MCE0538070.1 hypothetical protein [Kineosporia rhizophila]